MEGPISGLDWDDGNSIKCQKHGVSLREIETLLTSLPRVAPALNHSSTEDRYVAVGRNDKGRPLFVVFTLRRKNGKLLLRPISARYMHAKEMKAYETENSANDD